MGKEEIRMIKAITTVTDATQEWVARFNEVPVSVIRRLGDYEEIVAFGVDDEVYYDCDNGEDITAGHGVITGIAPNDHFHVAPDNQDGKPLLIHKDDLFRPGTCSAADDLPTWGYMWSFDNPADRTWLESKDGINAMAECGFRVSRQPDFSLIFGTDQAISAQMWEKLYKARGLQWHI